MKGHGFSRATTEAYDAPALAAEGCFFEDSEPSLRGQSPGVFSPFSGTTEVVPFQYPFPYARNLHAIAVQPIGSFNQNDYNSG